MDTSLSKLFSPFSNSSKRRKLRGTVDEKDKSHKGRNKPTVAISEDLQVRGEKKEGRAKRLCGQRKGEPRLKAVSKTARPAGCSSLASEALLIPEQQQQRRRNESIRKLVCALSLALLRPDGKLIRSHFQAHSSMILMTVFDR